MVTPAAFEEIDVETLATVLADPAEVQLIDVREPQEIEMAAIAAFDNLPLSQFQVWGDNIHGRYDADRETLVLCHHGMRSAQMCQWLMDQGFTRVKNIRGGIDAYSVRIDPAVPRY